METRYSILSYEELVSRIKKSDHQAFHELYERSWEKFYTQAASKLKNDDLAKDVVQDIFVDLWTKRESLAIDKIFLFPDFGDHSNTLPAYMSKLD